MPAIEPQLPGRLGNVRRSPAGLLGAWLWSRHPVAARIVGSTALLIFVAFVVWVFTR